MSYGKSGGKEYRCRGIVGGYAEGFALLSKEPINLLTIDSNGVVNDHTSMLYGKSVSDAILIFPNAIGSSVGAYRLYALKVNNKAPSGIVCINTADIITASAAAISGIPLVDRVGDAILGELESAYGVGTDTEAGANVNVNLRVSSSVRVRVRVDAYAGIISIVDDYE